MHIRRLTPLECERLQGFPDGWTEGVSDTQRYKTLGNAVTVNVIRDVASRLLLPHSPTGKPTHERGKSTQIRVERGQGRGQNP